MRRRGRGRLVAAPLITALALTLTLPRPAATEDLEALKREAAELVEQLRRELEATRAERAELQRERKELETQRSAAPAPQPKPTGEQPETERRVDIIAEELERLKSAVVLPETKEYKSIYGLGPAASKVYQIARGLSLGGYGEGFLNKPVSDTRGAQDRADALRFVLYTGYKFSDRIILNSEIEFEHATTSSTVSSGSGSVSVEFAYLDFLGWDYLNARAGLVLIPMGFINEIHEPVYFHGNNRPEVERTIIPTTWRELGIGIFGSPHEDVQYRGYVTTSLDARGFSTTGIRGGRQSGNRALAENYAGSGRIDYTPHQLPGALIGGSAFLGETGQNNAFAGEEVDALLSLWDLHAQYRFRGLELRALAAWGALRDSDFVSRELERTVGDGYFGHYAEVAYDVMPLIFPDQTRQYLAPFFRYERFDAQDSVPDGFERDATQNTELYTVGLTYKPHPQVALKLDYRNFETRNSVRADDVNVGLGFIF